MIIRKHMNLISLVDMPSIQLNGCLSKTEIVVVDDSTIELSLEFEVPADHMSYFLSNLFMMQVANVNGKPYHLTAVSKPLISAKKGNHPTVSIHYTGAESFFVMHQTEFKEDASVPVEVKS